MISDEKSSRIAQMYLDHINNFKEVFRKMGILFIF